MKKSYQLIIFDWDGTLMDSTPRIVSSMRTAASKVALPVPSEDAVNHIIGLSLDDAFEILFPGILSKHQQKQALFEAYRYEYLEGDTTPSPLFEDAEPLLKLLKSEGYRLAVATGKARHGLERIFKVSGLKKYFNDSICADEAESKPHPEMIHVLLERQLVSQHHCLMIGDTSHDLLMAKEAGVDAIGVTTGAHTKDTLLGCEPTHMVERLSQIEEWLGVRNA